MLRVLGFIAMAAMVESVCKKNGSTKTQSKPISQKKTLGEVKDLSFEQISDKLRSLYVEKDLAYKKLENINRDLSNVRNEFEESKSKLDQWYKHANGNWLGNGGRELPKHAIFSQSTSDRDYYKQEKSRLGRRIGELKAEKKAIFEIEISALKSNIEALKFEKKRRRH